MTNTTGSREPYGDELGALARAARVIGARARSIAFSLLLILLVLIVLMVGIYVASPSRKTASIPFRLEFQGAEEGTYPNELPFNVSEIVMTPILQKIFRQNGLEQFVSFDDFSDSVYVVESNPEMQRVANEYRSRLSDPRLGPVDRERIEREYQQRIESLGRSKYAINFTAREGTVNIPDELIEKSLLDILELWAEHAEMEKGVLRYQVPVLTSNILPSEVSSDEPLIALDWLRSKVIEIIRNIDVLRSVPGADVQRTRDGASLVEIRLNLEDLVSLRLRPLMNQFIASGSLGDRNQTILYFESQLSHNRHRMNEAEARVRALKQSLALYAEENRVGGSEESGTTRAETVMPQLGESFLDRLVEMARQPADLEFRKDSVEEITRASLEVIPYASEVDYYEELLGDVRRSSGGALTEDQRSRLARELESSNASVRSALDQVHAIYDLISTNLNSSNLLYRVTGPIRFDTLRSVSLRRLLLIALVIFLFSIPVTIFAVLIRNRISAENGELA